MRWIAVISEAIKNGTSNDLLIPGIVFYAILIGGFAYVFFLIIKRRKYMKKTYEEVVEDFVQLMEKEKIEQEYKDKMMFLLQKAKTNKKLLDFYKTLLFRCKEDPIFDKKNALKAIIYGHYHSFQPLN